MKYILIIIFIIIKYINCNQIQFNLDYLSQCTDSNSPCTLKSSNAWIPELPADNDDVVIDVSGSSDDGYYYYMDLTNTDLVFNSLSIVGQSGNNNLNLDISNSNLNTTNQLQIKSASVYFSSSSNSFGSLDITSSGSVIFPAGVMNVDQLSIDDSSNINIKNSQFYLNGLINGQALFQDSYITFDNSSLFFQSGFTFSGLSYQANITNESIFVIRDGSKTTTFKDCVKSMVSVNTPSQLELFNATLYNVNLISSNHLIINSTSSIDSLYCGGQLYISESSGLSIFSNAIIKSNVTVNGALVTSGSTFECQYLTSPPYSAVALGSTTITTKSIISYDIEFNNPSTIPSLNVLSSGCLELTHNVNLTVQDDFTMGTGSTLFLFYSSQNYQHSTEYYKTPLITVDGQANIQPNTKLQIVFSPNVNIYSNFSITLVQIVGDGNKFINTENLFSDISFLKVNNYDQVSFDIVVDSQSIKLVASISGNSNNNGGANGSSNNNNDSNGTHGILKKALIIAGCTSVGSVIIVASVIIIVKRSRHHNHHHHHHHHHVNENSHLIG